MVVRLSSFARLENRGRLFECGWSWGVVDGAAEVPFATGIGPQPAGVAEAAGSHSALPPDGLSPRELEVLRLVAQGLSNAQIAEQLIVSPHTVHAHVSSIHSKLRLSTRSAVTRYAFEHHLA